ncbi:MAG: hypothetical protein ABSG31_12695 [Tepidisphaeraceae bacterium]|jgi:hypothetical protein
MVVGRICLGLTLLVSVGLARAAESLPFEQIIWSSPTGDLADFDRAAARAKELGFTHMVITQELPRSFWQFDVVGDPYPAWYDQRPGILKICPPEAIQKYIDADWSAKVLQILSQRCEVLKKYGLKGVYVSNEPQVLPEAVFTDHPLWRGPRVDQPNRSRTARFAPCTDSPEVLDLYRKATADLIRHCPEITNFQFLTTDSGSGLSWAPSLYPGQNGPAWCKDRPMAQRVAEFLAALQQGAADAGGQIEISMYQIRPEEWMTPTFPDPISIVKQLPKGLAINNLEAPDATPYSVSAGGSAGFDNFYSPVRGIASPVGAVASLSSVWNSKAPRLTYGAIEDCDQLYADVFAKFAAHPAITQVQQDELLEQLAADQAGPENVQDLLAVWQSISKAAEIGSLLRWCNPTDMGSVHQRWLTRPFVPFPNELPVDQTAYYRKFLFEARSETQAEDLVDCQAMRLYEGWPGRMFITNVYDRVEPELKNARRHLATIEKRLPDDKRAPFADLDLRLQVELCMCTNARDAVNYQAVLDYIKGKNRPPEENPPLGTGSSWDRQMILEIARDEIDNTAQLIELLKSSPEPLLQCATSADEEDITLLGPDVVDQLKTKIDIMNAHWEDYKRITTTPNP